MNDHKHDIASVDSILLNGKRDTTDLMSMFFYYASVKSNTFEMQTEDPNIIVFVFQQKFDKLFGGIEFEDGPIYPMYRSIEIARDILGASKKLIDLGADELYRVDQISRESLWQTHSKKFSETEHFILQAMAEVLLAIPEKLKEAQVRGFLDRVRFVNEYCQGAAKKCAETIARYTQQATMILEDALCYHDGELTPEQQQVVENVRVKISDGIFSQEGAAAIDRMLVAVGLDSIP